MKKNFTILIFIFTCLPFFAQTIFLPNFDIESIFGFKPEKPYVNLDTNAKLGFFIQASPIAYFDSNFEIKMPDLLAFAHPNKEQRLAGEFLFFNAALTFPKMNNSGVDLAFFYGLYDTLSSAVILEKTSKTKINEPEFQDFYPGSAFKPDTSVNGIGFSIYGATRNPAVCMGSYTYWNGLVKEKMAFSQDFKLGFTTSNIVFNSFVGVNFPNNIKELTFRTGFTTVMQAGNDYEFYTAFGIANLGFEKLNPESFSKKIYAIFEPRVKLPLFNAAFAFFTSPVYTLPEYLNDPALEDSIFVGLNANLAVGNLDRYDMQGGVNILATVNPQKPAQISPFTFSISPFYSVIIERYLLDIRIPISPFMYNNISELVKVQISLKAVF